METTRIPPDVPAITRVQYIAGWMTAFLGGVSGVCLALGGLAYDSDAMYTGSVISIGASTAGVLAAKVAERRMDDYSMGLR